MSDLVTVILPRAAGEGDHPQDGGGGGRRLGIGNYLQIAWRQITRCEAAAAPSTAFGGPAPPLRGGGSAVLEARLPDGSLARFITDLFAYGLVSVAALACDCGLLMLLVHVGLHYLVASALSFTAGMVLAYVLSVRFVFRTRRSHSREVEAVGFVAVGVAGLVLTQVLLYVLVARLALALAAAKIVTTGIVFFFNFVTRRSLVFAGSSRAAA